MYRKRQAVAASSAAGGIVSLVGLVLIVLAMPRAVAASRILPQSVVAPAGGDEDPPPPPPPPPVGTLWVDDFEDGSTEGWHVGQQSPFQPRNVADGGPLGAGDNYLRLQSSGGDENLPGSRFVVLNRNPIWTQDLHERGIKRIEMDVLNLNSFYPLQLRFAAYTLGPNGFASKDPITLVADGKWRHVVIPFSAEAMTQLGEMTFEEVLDGFEEVRILSSSVASLRGDSVRAEVGIDNIKVVTTPEPASIASAGIALGWAILRRRRRNTGPPS